jgi:hypothetical protein
MADTPPAPSGGGKILGLKPRTAIIGGVIILAAAIGYMLWKRHQSAPAATASASASSSTSGVDYGGELSVIQSELEDLLAAEGRSASASTSTAGTGTSTGATTGSAPAATATAAKTAAPATPSGVHTVNVTSNSVGLAWTKVPNATSYRIRVTYQGKLVGSGSPASPSGTIHGLTPDHTYTFHVAAVGPGGTSSETNGPAVKTSK